MGLFIAVGVLFVPFGTWLNLEYAKVVSIEQIYDGEGTTNADCSISASNEGKEVSVARPNEVDSLAEYGAWCLVYMW